MTLAHHDTAQRDQWRGCKAYFLSAEQERHGDVPTGLDLPVCLQYDTRTQVIFHQRLVCLGNSQLPG